MTPQEQEAFDRSTAVGKICATEMLEVLGRAIKANPGTSFHVALKGAASALVAGGHAGYMGMEEPTMARTLVLLHLQDLSDMMSETEGRPVTLTMEIGDAP